MKRWAWAGTRGLELILLPPTELHVDPHDHAAGLVLAVFGRVCIMRTIALDPNIDTAGTGKGYFLICEFLSEVIQY